MVNDNLVGGWPANPSEKYDFVSWDYDIPNWMEKHVPKHVTHDDKCHSNFILQELHAVNWFPR